MRITFLLCTILFVFSCENNISHYGEKITNENIIEGSFEEKETNDNDKK